MLEHGPINFAKDILADMNGGVWVNPNDVGIIGGMMNFAQPESV
jgi:hypothetical protein